MGFLKNYGFSLLLLAGVIAGGICGAVWGEGTAVVRPVGELFLNIVFILIVPLIIFSISSATCKLCRSGIAWRLLGTTLGTFIVMSAVAGLVGFILFMIWNPFTSAQPEAFLANIQEQEGSGSFSIKGAIASSLLYLIAASMLAGFIVAVLKEKGNRIAAFLESATNWIVKIVSYVMYAAPIGIGCYFAWTVGSLGGTILGEYAGAVYIYLIAALVVFVVINSSWVMISGGPGLLARFWRGMVTPSLTAIATASSAVCIPLNLEAAKGMGVRPLVADSVIPLGTNIHKDGSVIGGVVKVVFLLTVFGGAAPSWEALFVVVGVGILVGTVMGAVPTGGMTGELLICSVFGYPPEIAAVLMVISTLIDIPATLLNSTGNVVASVLVNKLSPEK